MSSAGMAVLIKDGEEASDEKSRITYANAHNRTVFCKCNEVHEIRHFFNFTHDGSECQELSKSSTTDKMCIRQEMARNIYVVGGPKKLNKSSPKYFLQETHRMFEVTALESIRDAYWMGQAGEVVEILFVLQLRVACGHVVSVCFCAVESLLLRHAFHRSLRNSSGWYRHSTSLRPSAVVRGTRASRHWARRRYISSHKPGLAPMTAIFTRYDLLEHA
jgi:hypothetical protein